MSEASDLLKMHETIIDNRSDVNGDPDGSEVREWPRFNAKTIIKVKPDGTALLRLIHKGQHISTKPYQCKNHATDAVTSWLDTLEQGRIASGIDGTE